MRHPVRHITALAFVAAFASVCWAQEKVPQPPRPPNILLIAVDTVRADRLGCYGYKKTTSPNIDRLASEGVVFDECVSVASWTLSAFVSVMTGHLPASHGCKGTESALSPQMPTLPQRLKKHGYYCAAVVSNPFLNAKFGLGRGFDKYDDYTVFLDAELALLGSGSPGEPKEVAELVTGATVTRQAKMLLASARKSGKPFFLFVHYFDPHDSYIPPSPYNRQFDDPYSGPVDGRQVPSYRRNPPAGRDLEHLNALYDGEIAYDDAQVGQLVKAIDESSDPAGTLIIFLSDHGEAFAEHGMLLHGNSAYREEVWVPMIWRWKGVLPAGTRVKSPVAITDVAATLGKLLGFDEFQTIHSQSLWPGLLGGQLPAQREILSDKCLGGSGYHLAVTRGKLRLHARFDRTLGGADTKYELYDVSRDPWEKNDLAGSNPSELESIKAALTRIWSECLDLRKQYNVDAPANRVILSDKERRRLQGLGYTDSPAGK